MHGEILGHVQAANAVPGNRRFPRREHIGIADRGVVFGVSMGVHIVAHHQVHPAGGFQRIQLIQNLLQRGFIQPVIRIHHFKIAAGGQLQALIDALAVAAVFLMVYADGFGVAACPFIGDLPGFIVRAIVNDNDLHPGRPREQRSQAFFHVILRIVAGHRDGKGFLIVLRHCSVPPCSGFSFSKADLINHTKYNTSRCLHSQRTNCEF